MMLMTLTHFLFGTLRGRLIMSVATVHAVMMALFIGDLTMRQRALFLDGQIEETTAVSQALATSAAGWIAAHDISGLQELVEAQRSYPEILFAILADKNGHVLADTDKSRQGLYLLDLPREARRTVLSGTPSLVDVVAPAMIGGRHVGWARVGIGQEHSATKLAEITRNGVVYALAAILGGSFIAWLMGRRITGRLYAVQKTISAVRSGNRLARSTIAGTDEAAVMGREFNSMLDALAERDAELRASEERYRSLIQKAQSAILLHDGQGRVLNSNPMAQELLGLSSDQLLGKALVDPEWHFLREDGSVMPVAEYPVSLVISKRRPLRGHVTGISRPDRDDFVWVLVNAEPEYDADTGEIVLVVVSFVDMTERKRSEEKLHRLNRELQAISTCIQTLMRADDEQALLGDICRIVCDEAGYRMAWVGYAENDDDKTIRPVAWSGAEDGYLEQAGFSWADTEWGRGPSGIAIRSGECACIQDFTSDPQAAPWRDSALQRGYRSSIALPLKDESAHVFGTLNIYSAKPQAFIPDEIRLLEELSGNLAFGIMVLRDRIERKRAEEELSHLAAIVEFSDEAIIGKSLDGTIMSWNKGAERLYGYREEEVKGRSISILIPQDLDGEMTFILDQIKQGLRVEHYETLRLRKDGSRFVVSVTASPICDSDGKIIGTSTFSHDITERKQMEEKLRLAGAYNRSLIEASLDPLVTIDAQGRITDVNAATESATGCSRTELIGTDFSDYFTVPEDARSGNEQAFRESVVKNYPLEIRHLDGQVTPVLYNASVFRNDAGDVVGLFAAARDISERLKAESELQNFNLELEQRITERIADLNKRGEELSESQQALMNIVEDLNEKTDELEQANAKLQELGRLKSMFIASMSHELRTPLNSIIGFSSIILNEWVGPLNDEQKENLAIILKAGKHLLSLINDVIDVSKIEAGKIESVPEGFDLHELVLEAVSLVKKDLDEKGIELRVVTTHQQVQTDRRRLLQCLLNLLSNAVKFSEQGSVTVEMRIIQGAAQTPETGVVEISVTDTGIGIREEDLPKLFKPFVRLAPPGQTTIPGTGLGLYLTRKLAAEVLKGDIVLTSEYGKGSRFTIKIPLRLP